jgi:glycosyltransferase involved in cell wall biosynthesis
MPIYNCEAFVQEAIESILQQTYTNFELIIINDNSTDRTGTIARSFKDQRIRYFQNNVNKGVTATLNIALRHCRGSLIARMDGDDISHRRRLERQVDFLSKNLEVGLVSCRYLVDDTLNEKTNLVSRHLDDSRIRFHMLFRNQFVHPGVMMRASVMKKLSYHEIPTCEDYDLWSRALDHCKVANCSETLLVYRWHGSNVSIVNQAAMRKSMLYIISALLTNYGIEHSQEELLLQSMIALGFNKAQLSLLKKTQEMEAWLRKLSGSSALIDKFGARFVEEEIKEYKQIYEFN